MNLTNSLPLRRRRLPQGRFSRPQRRNHLQPSPLWAASWLAGWLVCLVCAGAAEGQAASGDSPSRPNILLITADNLGYGDLPCFNPDSPIIAPRLSALASQGARLTSFYTASPTCTVSRACLLTGRVPQRHGLTYQLPGIAGNYGRGLDPSEVLIPQVLQAAGYATGCFGKWNIGFAPGSRPTERGFDRFFGHASGNIDYYTHNYNQQHDLYEGIEEARVKGYATDLFADAAIGFIEEQSAEKRPWFVYLPFNAPHFPNARNKAPGEATIWQAPDEAFAAYQVPPDTTDARQRYRAVVTALDTAIGRVLDALEKSGVADNTFVFFYSDNGAFMLKDRGLEVASNAPLRDGGVTCWEGGLRVAAMARWPKQIPPGTVVDQPLWSCDLLPACARLAAAPLPKQPLDGKDPLPVLKGEQPTPHQSFYFEYQGHAALRMGEWKIVRTAARAPWQLYRLSDDLGEQTDLADSHPEALQQLVGRFTQWQTELAADWKSRNGEMPRWEVPASADDDPLAEAFAPNLRSTVEVVLDNYRKKRKYRAEQFPLNEEPFAIFRQEIRQRLAESLRMTEWVVRQPATDRSPISGKFRDRLVRRVAYAGVELELHALTFPESELVVPVVICLPKQPLPAPRRPQRIPGVCVFSGHSRHGLRDLVLDLDSYQQGLAVRLAQAGIASVAVEKIDVGTLSRDGRQGNDEQVIATTLLHWGEVTRAHQLKACLAASEVLALHPRVDASRIGATGVSLGGWLSVQTALLSDRISAIADFGRKTRAIAPEATAKDFAGQADLCHILPGMLALCDRNVMALAVCPRPLLAGHGRQDAGSADEAPVQFAKLFRTQYEYLNQAEEFTYLEHEGGDTMPAERVIAWFQGQFSP